MKRSIRVHIGALVMLAAAFSAAGRLSAAAQASITIEQISPAGVGDWTFLSSGATYASRDPKANKLTYSIAVTDFGPTTLMVTTPAGMSVKIGVYRGNELLKSILTPQYSFTLFPNDNYRFVVQYSLSREGSLGITSVPSGIRFRMKGPTARAYTGTTPVTLKNIPSGQYSVSLTGTDNCVQPKPYAAVVEPEKRSTLNITLSCDQKAVGAEWTRRQPSRRSLIEYVENREYKTRGNRK